MSGNELLRVDSRCPSFDNDDEGSGADSDECLGDSSDSDDDNLHGPMKRHRTQEYNSKSKR